MSISYSPSPLSRLLTLSTGGYIPTYVNSGHTKSLFEFTMLYRGGEVGAGYRSSGRVEVFGGRERGGD